MEDWIYVHCIPGNVQQGGRRCFVFFVGGRSQFYTETNWTLSKGTYAHKHLIVCMHLRLIWSFEITLLGIESFTLTLVYSQAITRDRWSFSPPPPPSPCPNSCCVSKPFPTLDTCPGSRNGISLCITPSDVTRGYKMNMTFRGPLLPCHCSL